MPIPTSAARRIERAARAAAHEPGLDLLDRALTALAENAARRGVAVPDVRIVRVTADTVILDLAAPASDPIAPFTVAHESRWVLDSALLPAGPLPTGRYPRADPGRADPLDSGCRAGDSIRVDPVGA